MWSTSSPSSVRGAGFTVAALFFARVLCAQVAGGSIRGVVIDPLGAPLGGAEIQAILTANHAIYRATSAANGSYTIPALPAGNYELAVLVHGGRRFTRNDVKIEAGATLRFDPKLEDDGQLGAIGDNFLAAAALARRPAPTGPPPKALDGHVDLSGVWAPTKFADEGKPNLLPWAAAELEKRKENSGKDIPTAFCLPWGPTLDIPVTYKFIQSPQTIVILFEDVFSYRQIHMDGRGHPKDGDPSWMGHSIGRWEGDTLVVDTAGFNDKSWTPVPYPHTEKLHMTERFRRPDAGHLEIETTIEDPGTYTAPWTFKLASNLLVGEEIGEYICAENNQYTGHGAGN